MQETLKPNILLLICAIGCLNIVTAKHLVSKRSGILNEGKSTGSLFIYLFMSFIITEINYCRL